MDFISITNVVVKKDGKASDYDVFEHAWQALFQRFENTLKNGNFPGGARNDLVSSSRTPLTGSGSCAWSGGCRFSTTSPTRTNSVRGVVIFRFLRVIEDPYPKDSKDSLFIQAVDVCAYFLLQRARPNAFIRRAGAERYLHRLLPVLNKKATTANALGVVLL